MAAWPTSGSVMPAGSAFMSPATTRTPRRDSASPISSPMAPRPSMPTLAGSSSRSNSVSVVSTRSPSAFSKPGTTGPEPVATITALASTRRPSTSSVLGPTKRARPISRSSPAADCVRLAVLPASMSRVARAWRHRSMGRWAPAGGSAPFNSVRSVAHCAPACSTAFDGMQPTRAQVVPSGPWLISTRDRPSLPSSAKAPMPAVPAPMMATSVWMGAVMGISFSYMRKSANTD